MQFILTREIGPAIAGPKWEWFNTRTLQWQKAGSTREVLNKGSRLDAAIVTGPLPLGAAETTHIMIHAPEKPLHGATMQRNSPRLGTLLWLAGHPDFDPAEHSFAFAAHVLREVADECRQSDSLLTQYLAEECTAAVAVLMQAVKP
jgi:hypothetical protein